MTAAAKSRHFGRRFAALSAGARGATRLTRYALIGARLRITAQGGLRLSWAHTSHFAQTQRWGTGLAADFAGLSTGRVIGKVSAIVLGASVVPFVGLRVRKSRFGVAMAHLKQWDWVYAAIHASETLFLGRAGASVRG